MCTVTYDERDGKRVRNILSQILVLLRRRWNVVPERFALVVLGWRLETLEPRRQLVLGTFGRRPHCRSLVAKRQPQLRPLLPRSEGQCRISAK